MAVMKRLRAETRVDHDRVEATPFAQAMMAGKLPLGRYLEQLACYGRIHEVLEGRLSVAREPSVAAVWEPAMERLPALREDLEGAGAGGWVFGSGVERALTSLLDAVASASDEELLGMLYVMEGSAMGNAFLLPRLQGAWGEGAPYNYFRGRGVGTAAHFRAFGERMDRALSSEEQESRAVEGARTFFRGMFGLLMALSEGLPAMEGARTVPAATGAASAPAV